MLLKLLMLLWLLDVPLKIVAQYHQTDYKVDLKIVEISDYNRSYLRDVKFGLQWYNRTTRVINGNGTFLKDLRLKLQVKVQLYKFLSNEYRFFPLTHSMEVCADLPKNMFGIKESLLNYTNFPTACPFEKGFYYVRNGRVDFSQYPPFMPTGDYKMEQKLFNGDDFVAVLDAYGSVKDTRKLLVETV